MRILVTGGAGFIGSYLCEALIAKGNQVAALDDLSTGSTKNIFHLFENPNFVFHNASITNRQIVEKLISDCDVVMHFAAAVGVTNIIENPIGSLQTNIQGTENVLFASVNHEKEVILASSSEIYGKNPAVPLKEESDRVLGSPLKSRWTYSEAKAIDESLARALFEEQGLKVKIVRLFNTVGPRQSAAYGMVIPRFFKAALNDEPIIVHGDGLQSRVFCHISDAISGIISLWESNGGFGEAFNLGGFEETSILNLANRIRTMAKSNSEIKFVPYENLPGGFEDISRRVPSNEKLEKLSGWTAIKDLDSILADILNHLKFENN